jgi:hypothetical protein
MALLNDDPTLLDKLQRRELLERVGEAVAKGILRFMRRSAAGPSSTRRCSTIRRSRRSTALSAP